MLLNKNTNLEYKIENKENINYLNKNIDNIGIVGDKKNINNNNLSNINIQHDKNIYQKYEK